MSRNGPARATVSAVGVLALTAALSACANGATNGNGDDADSSAGSPGPAAGKSFPAVIDTKFGEVTVDEPPERVVALGWGDAETALALGLQPVGASDWLEFGGSGVGPWATDLYDEPPTLIGTLEPSYEDILALEPDLILDVKSSGDRERYERLSEIATTVGVPEGGDNYLTNQRQQVRMIATALGKPEQGKALLADVRQRFHEVTEAHPEFEDATVTVAAYTSEGWGAYIEQTERVRFMKRLGFVPNPSVERLDPDGFTAPIPDEDLELLDADLMVVFPIGQSAATVRQQPLYDSIPAVRDGRSVLLDQQSIANAYSVNSVLSIPYALEHVTPLLADAMASE